MSIIGLVVASLVVAVVILSLNDLYQKNFEKQRMYLANIAQSHAQIIAAEVKGTRNLPFAAMKRIAKSLGHTDNFAQTGDILISRNEGGFASLMAGRHKGSTIDQVAIDNERSAQPVHMDFQGQTGAIIGPDFRNIEVLAAYAPVKDTNLVVIAKIDMAEIRAPFIRSVVVSSGALLLLIIMGTLNCIIEDPIVKDIKQARLQLIHTSKMATLGEMSSGIAHELNQPLSIIRMAADFALMSMHEKTPDKQLITRKLETITSQGDRILAIISQMRAFSRKEGPYRVPFMINDAVSVAVGMIEPQLRAAGIDLKVVSGDAGNCKIMGSPVQLEQVLLNILANAHDTVRNRMESIESKESTFTPMIKMAVNRIRDEGTVLISISNNGGNIPEWIMDNIFDPFFTTKKKGQGTGLGLSISNSIITSLGGHIEARNIPDGARFDITIPTI